MSRTVLSVLLAAVVLFAGAALLGDGEWVVPVAVLFAIVAAGLVGHLVFRRRVGTDTALPAAHLESASGAPLGDTSEAHDEISPRALPKSHPGRAEAERAARFDTQGTTTGNVER